VEKPKKFKFKRLKVQVLTILDDQKKKLAASASSRRK
jgi:hypothetical protein